MDGGSTHPCMRLPPHPALPSLTHPHPTHPMHPSPPPQVATLQHEQPVVTRAHMAAPVFIKQDAKEFVFGTLSTSQGSNTMCPLCKRGSETNELTPQAIQHMMLLAKAIGEGVSAVAEAERISVEKVERVLEEAHSVREIPIPGES